MYAPLFGGALSAMRRIVYEEQPHELHPQLLEDRHPQPHPQPELSATTSAAVSTIMSAASAEPHPQRLQPHPHPHLPDL